MNPNRLPAPNAPRPPLPYDPLHTTQRLHQRSDAMKHTLTALVHDHPGALNRAVSLFRRRGLNIESLTVTRSGREGVSQMTWVFEAPSAAPLVAQLEKLVDVLEVREVHPHGPAPRAPQHGPPYGPSHGGANVPVSSFALSQADGIA